MDCGKMKGKKEKILLIASYKRKYSEYALDKIKKIIQRMEPDKIIIIKVIEERPTKELVDAAVGMEEKTAMLETVKNEKKVRADDMASDIVDIVGSLGIPTDVCFRTGEHISDEIIKEFKKQNADLLIIHDTKKGRLDKLFGSNTTKEIMEELDEERVIRL